MTPDKRNFTSYDMVALWVGLVVCVPAWTLAGGLLELGLSISWSVAVLFVGSCLLLPALLLNAHGGTKYGVPFPVLARQAFGVRGANLVSLLRGIVAAGWFGIQTWFGGEAIHTICESSGVQEAAFGTTGFMRAEMSTWWAAGLMPSQLLTFSMFWVLQAGIIWRGMNLIRGAQKHTNTLTPLPYTHTHTRSRMLHRLRHCLSHYFHCECRNRTCAVARAS